MELIKRIQAFGLLSQFLAEYKYDVTNENDYFTQAITKANYNNPWFTLNNIDYAINAIAKSITKTEIESWIQHYSLDRLNPVKLRNVGVIMAGNLPLVGFHDFFYVLMSGHRILAKLSSDDIYLLPAIAKKLIEFEPEFINLISFADNKLENFDAVIATGSNNTARYFEYYFGKYPHIIRKNRNAIAILSGKENKIDLNNLSNDILRHFGKGCRNVSKIFVPEDYNFNMLLETLAENAYMVDNTKYINNYDYYKSIYLINSQAFYDNGCVILKEENLISSPISVIYYEFYNDLNLINNFILDNQDKIQCVVSSIASINNAVSFGKAQSPDLSDYADGIDVMAFLINS
jgi:hypothetical protein